MTMVILNASSGFCMCLLYILLASAGAATKTMAYFSCAIMYSYSLTNKGACMIIVFELNAVDC